MFRSVTAIKKRDFFGFITSPKAGFIFLVFVLLMGVSFYGAIQYYVKQANPMFNQGQGNAVDINLILKYTFQNLQLILLLTLPGITMGAFVDERRTHSIRLLLSSPLSMFEIVFGKFSALLAVMTLVLIFTSVFPIFVAFHGGLDAGVVFSSYLGVILLMGAQVSFGLWISSLCDNQLVAAILTIFGLFGLLILDWIGNMVTQAQVSAVIKSLAINPHFSSFLDGAITVADTSYFICFIALFVFLSTVTIEAKKWR